MAAASTAPTVRTSGPISRKPASGSLAEVVDIILDKGLVLDVYARISLIGIELITIDVRVVIASVDTYLHFAEATNRLDLRGQSEERDSDLTDIISGGAESKTKGAIEGAGEKVREGGSGAADKIKSVFGEDDDEDGEDDEEQES